MDKLIIPGGSVRATKKIKTNQEPGRTENRILGSNFEYTSYKGNVLFLTIEFYVNQENKERVNEIYAEQNEIEVEKDFVKYTGLVFEEPEFEMFSKNAKVKNRIWLGSILVEVLEAEVI